MATFHRMGSLLSIYPPCYFVSTHAYIFLKKNSTIILILMFDVNIIFNHANPAGLQTCISFD